MRARGGRSEVNTDRAGSARGQRLLAGIRLGEVTAGRDAGNVEGDRLMIGYGLNEWGAPYAHRLAAKIQADT